MAKTGDLLDNYTTVLSRETLPPPPPATEGTVNPAWMIVDNSGAIWLGQLGSPKYVGFQLEYWSNDQTTGSFPLLALSWIGTGFDAGILSSEWYFQPAYKSLLAHLQAHDLSLRVWTVIVVVALLGAMWVYGESVYIINGIRDSKEMAIEFEGIKALRAEQRRTREAQAGEAQPGRPAKVEPEQQTYLNYPIKWGAKLKKWRERKKLVRKASSGLSMRAVFSSVLFFGIGMGVVAVFLILAPHPPNATQEAEDLADPWFYVNPFRNLDQYGWYDFFCFGALVLETLLFLWALLKVNWPAKGVKERAIEADLEAAMLLQEEALDQVALLIAAHKCDSTKEKREGLRAALRAALRRFPASSIFVCDNALTEAPPDATYELVQEVCREESVTEQINYVYLPVGNKTVAFFWTIDVWMPILEKHQICPHFKYVMMIDDDVQVPEELRLPLRSFGKERDVQAYAYCINCFHNTQQEAAGAPMLVRYQNMEYIVAGFFKQFQAAYGTALACHGAISLWRREILTSKILWDHDTVFNGEDLQMGLILHSMKAGYAINVSSREIVMTEPPSDFYTLWKQRVKSWDVTQHRKTLTFIQIVLFQWCGGIRTLILKPFLLMEIFNITQDWARIFFFGYLLTYNEGRVHLAQWLVYLILLQWLGLLIFHKKTLRHRKQDRDTWAAYMLYPVVYKPLTQVFRWYALLESIVRREAPAAKIRDKEELQILPPKPFMKPDEIDWNTVWTADVPEGYEELNSMHHISEVADEKGGHFFV
eukprot:TRINITY_DN21698_c0_g1_i3.p1 TRINITY_DN21698_c0_g1~~TRINITY_DN21698_c0_g1_i3.p1  ORF type:complete len:763 (+),score=192.80 TRINITY_DN21698_c0_g1_i3:613-2901(+)